MKTFVRHFKKVLTFFVILFSFHFAIYAQSINPALPGTHTTHAGGTDILTVLANKGTSVNVLGFSGEGAYSVTDSLGIALYGIKVLPVTYGDVDACKVGEDIGVKWIIEHQLNMSHYEVEKSVDGAHFIGVATQEAANTGLAATYKWLDKNAVKGDNFYRIRNVHVDGSFLYSKIVKVNITKVKVGMNVYPNPVTNGNIGLQISNLPTGQYRIRLVNMAGQVMLLKSVSYLGGNSVKQIDFPTEMSKGIYSLEVVNCNNETTVIKVVY